MDNVSNDDWRPAFEGLDHDFVKSKFQKMTGHIADAYIDSKKRLR